MSYLFGFNVGDQVRIIAPPCGLEQDADMLALVGKFGVVVQHDTFDEDNASDSVLVHCGSETWWYYYTGVMKLTDELLPDNPIARILLP